MERDVKCPSRRPPPFAALILYRGWGLLELMVNTVGDGSGGKVRLWKRLQGAPRGGVYKVRRDLAW